MRWTKTTVKNVLQTYERILYETDIWVVYKWGGE